MPYGFLKAEVEEYRRVGYLLAESLFGPTDLEPIERTIRDIIETALRSGDYESILELEPEQVAGQPVVRRIYNPFERHQAFRDLATDDRILDRIESLIGPSIQLQHSKLNMKSAHAGSPVEWHQDLAYFPHTNPDLVTVLVYLDRATKENGCLQVLPGLHDRFLECHGPDGLFTGVILEDLSVYGEPVSLEGPPGSVIFLHCLTPHCSLPNRSPHPRRTLIFEYRAGDSYPVYFGPKVARDEELTHQLRGVPARYARMEGPAPLIPAMPGNFKSIFQLQSESKRKWQR